MLALCGSLNKLSPSGDWLSPWYKNGQWIHKEPAGYLVERQIMLHPISDFHLLNTDIFLDTYRIRSGDIWRSTAAHILVGKRYFFPDSCHDRPSGCH